MINYDRCQAVVCRLGRGVRPSSADGSVAANSKFVCRVLREEGIGYDDFRFLDESPGSHILGGYEGFHGEWHCYLRRARNDIDGGLFQVLEANEEDRDEEL